MRPSRERGEAGADAATSREVAWVLIARVYDLRMRLVILGGGPAGYAAAATAAHLGADVTLIEDNQLGGNCTMTDAIPSKTLLTTADAMLKISAAEEEGVDFARGFPEVNLRRTLARARAVALHQSRGVRERMDGMNVRVLAGRGRVTGPNTLVTTSTTASSRSVRRAAGVHRRVALRAAVRAPRRAPRADHPRRVRPPRAARAPGRARRRADRL